MNTIPVASTRTVVPEEHSSGTAASLEPTTRQATRSMGEPTQPPYTPQTLFGPTPPATRTPTTRPDGAYWPWATPTNPTTGAASGPGAAGPGPDSASLGYPAGTVATVYQRTMRDDYDQWLGHIKAASGCKHPIRLSGKIHVNNTDGRRIATYTTDAMPDGVIYTPCGNRRAAICPSCAEVYRRDTYHLIRAGLQGDRWGIPPLHEHIALFVTATAPSFGTVHRRVVKLHAADCRHKTGCTCRPEVCHPFGRPCPHGQPTACRDRHSAADSRIGQPLCMDCYDYPAHVVWHHEASELWRRTIQQVRRNLERLGRALGVELVRRYLKVYEFQRRGVIHYHAFIRLDGRNPDCPEAIVPPPAVVTRTMLENAVRAAFAQITFTSAPHPGNGDRGWVIAWGDPDKGLDIQHVNAPGGEVNLNQLTGYVAKYVTKATEVTGTTLRRVDDLIVEYLDPAEHTHRLIKACWDLGAEPGWERLRRYAHQYGYGGHITTKSRRFSVTYGFQRLQRTIWRRTQGHPETWHDQETDLVIYELGYHATGWITTGDALLANTAAALARDYAQAAHDALTDPGTTPALPRSVAA